MLLLIQCIILCAVFTVIVFSSQYKDPVRYIMSYPPAIRKRVESLPQYKNVIQTKEKKHLYAKLLSVGVLSIVLAVVAFFSGVRTFSQAYFHVFMLFFAVNMYDVIVMDLGIFCHSKKLRIPGTEDMDKEYKNPWHHVRGGVFGIIIGAGIAFISSGMLSVVSLFLE